MPVIYFRNGGGLSGAMSAPVQFVEGAIAELQHHSSPDGGAVRRSPVDFRIQTVNSSLSPNVSSLVPGNESSPQFGSGGIVPLRQDKLNSLTPLRAPPKHRQLSLNQSMSSQELLYQKIQKKP